MEKSRRKSERIKRLNKHYDDKSDALESPSKSLASHEKKTRNKFQCERCASSTIRGQFIKSRAKLKPKFCFDPQTKRTIKVCHSCAKIMTKEMNRIKKPKKIIDNDCKERYLMNAHSFAISLVNLLNDADAERLYCPQFKNSYPCACLQRYITSNDTQLNDNHNNNNNNNNNSISKAKFLLGLLKKAKALRQQKCYANSDTTIACYGNGQKRSKEYESFVMTQKERLRNELHLCERATQKVLFYSNNFMHKKLKTESGNARRIHRQKGRAAMGKLKDLSLITNEQCCNERCVRMALTHPTLVENWRKRATVGQSEARRVISEMLTPAQGMRINCYRFISLVTGSCHTTISSVNDYLRVTGGDREPPIHGLKKYWNELKRRDNQNVGNNKNSDNVLAFQNSSLTSPINVIVSHDQMVPLNSNNSTITLILLNSQNSSQNNDILQIPVTIANDSAN